MSSTKCTSAFGSRAIVLLAFGANMHLAVLAQADSANHHAVTHEEHNMKGSHRLSFGLGHTSISEGKVQGRTQWLPLASWSLNYDYWLSNKWAIGLQNDLILETFVVEHGNQEMIERKKPISVIPVGMYKFAHRWTGIAGAGVEFSEGHNLGLTRVGIEYGLPLPKNWEVGIGLVWDNKWNYFNSWGLTFMVSKIWPHKK